MGVVVDIDQMLDAALVEVDEDVASKLTADNFKIRGTDWAPEGVVIAAALRLAAEKVNSDKAKNNILNSMTQVRHSGNRLITEHGNPGTPGQPSLNQSQATVDGRMPMTAGNATRAQMIDRTTYPGDSGGPVFDSAHRLVGMVSMGTGAESSTCTDVVFVDDILQRFRVSLAVGPEKPSGLRKSF